MEISICEFINSIESLNIRSFAYSTHLLIHALIFAYSLKNINVIELAKASLSDLKENINDVVENAKLDYISINEVEHETSNVCIFV